MHTDTTNTSCAWPGFFRMIHQPTPENPRPHPRTTSPPLSTWVCVCPSQETVISSHRHPAPTGSMPDYSFYDISYLCAHEVRGSREHTSLAERISGNLRTHDRYKPYILHKTCTARRTIRRRKRNKNTRHWLFMVVTRESKALSSGKRLRGGNDHHDLQSTEK